MRLGKLAEGIWGIGLHKYLAPDASGTLIGLEELRRKLSITQPLPPIHEQKQSRLLVTLPADIVRHIFNCFGDPKDMPANIDGARFALTCQLCYQVGYGVLKRRQEAFRSWAGQRLIVTGDYCEANDLPPGLDLPPWFPPGVSIYTTCLSKSFVQAYPPLKDAVQKHYIEDCRHYQARSVAQAEKRQWKAMFAPVEPQMKNPTLRNLSKKEYARGDVLDAAQTGKDRDNGFGALRIGDLVAFRICWSSDSWGNMTNANIVPGEWAGDRFDIVDFADAAGDLQGWKDVSESLVQEVARIYVDEEWE
ncbi:hypothetical protein AURDEDRAFT_157364 [Auricularia subglabra TFB-10046 SS5]|nr:hypothetical protein AURDEDRAFT_157364 [Auricularia subglabra TFB-10046 SS5]